MVNPRCFLDFSHGGQPLGRVVFELFADRVPKTSENFRALCTGSEGVSKKSGVPMHYKGSVMHRVIDGFMVQGGDFTKKNGTGGESIYNNGTFEDEDLTMPIDKEGLLVMANRGPNTNGSQFFITLAPCPHLNGKHVLFGRAVGPTSMEVVKKIASVQVDGKDRPLSPVEVVHCGELELRKKAAPAPPRKRSASVSSNNSDDNSRSSSSSRSRSRSTSGSESESESEDERERKRRKKLAKKEKKEAKRAAKKARKEGKKGKKDDKKRKTTAKGKMRDERSPSPATQLRLEEEKREAARLAEEERRRTEIEEQERREAKLRELERLKREDAEARRRRGSSEEESDGIVYKGRGAMKYRGSGSSGGMRTAW